jgi:hypothetical protein
MRDVMAPVRGDQTDYFVEALDLTTLAHRR